MSLYSNVTEQDLINLRKLAEQQKEQRALKFKNRVLKQTHDKKLAESLSPITEKLDKVGEIIKETNTAKPDTLFENTLSKMKKNIGFFNIEERDNSDIFWNGFPVKKMGANKPKISENIFEITPGIQKVFT